MDVKVLVLGGQMYEQLEEPGLEGYRFVLPADSGVDVCVLDLRAM